MQTYGGYQWTLGEWRETDGRGDLCGPGWLHVYDDPILAVLLNPIHAMLDLNTMRLFSATWRGKTTTDNGQNRGVTRLRLDAEIEVPKITTEQHVRFGILCALEVCQNAPFVRGAKAWLDGSGRTSESAKAAAYAAAWAARVAAETKHSIDFTALAHRAMKEERSESVGRQRSADMNDEDRQALEEAHRRTHEANADVREIMEAQNRLRTSLKDAQGRAQAAHAAYTTLRASMVRKYGREEVEG